MKDKCDNDTQTCPVVGTQKANVSVPVTISPFAFTGPAKVKCIGEPVVTCNNNVKGKPNGMCNLTITQTLKIDVPVEFGAQVKFGDTFVDCICEEEKPDCGCDCK